MRKSLSSTIKYQSKLWTNNILGTLSSENIGTSEVQKFAASQAFKSTNPSCFKSCISVNMKPKVDNAHKELKEAKFDMVQSKIALKRLIKNDTIVYSEFQSVIDNEWNREWTIDKKIVPKKDKLVENREK